MWTKVWTMTAAALLAVGCAAGAGRPASPPGDTLAQIKASLAEDSRQGDAGKSSAEPPQAVSDVLLPGYRPSVELTEPDEERFDITVNRMNARTFFMSLVRDTPVNLVVHPDVKGVISLDLKSVTIDEVLEVARDVYGYEYQKNRAGYFIMPARLQSRIFNVSYLNVARQGESNTRVTSGQLATGEERNRGGGEGRGSRSPHNDRNTKPFASSRIATESKADFWSDLEATVRAIVGEADGRSVVVSPQSGLVVVRAMPGELRDVEAFLQSAELNLHRQVIIEAKVIEVQLNETFQAGINWAKVNRDAGDTDFASQFELFDGQSELVDQSGNFLASGLTGTRQQSGFGNIFALGTASDDFAVILRLLDQQGDVNVLSSPRVSTVNNQKAVIKVGSDEFFVTEISTTTTTGTATTTTPEIILTPFFSGIALDVTPQINERGQVTLHIHPTISEVTDQVKDITVAGQDQSLPLAFSTVRESDSIVRADSGQVIVIGGLMQNQLNDVTGGVPGLSKIPLLGHLFTQRKRTSRRSELVILLKPTVIGGDGRIWQDELQSVSGRIDQFGRGRR